MTTAYPLQWPDSWRRTTAPSSSRFNTSVSNAVRNVTDELRRFGKDTGVAVSGVVVSSNVTLTNQRPADPGVAAYFRWDNMDCCIAVDRYKTPEDNLQAIAKVIEAERTKMRHGGLNIVRAGFRGYAALPPAKGPDGHLPRPWRDVLGINEGATLEQAEAAYRKLVKSLHPDVPGGDPVKFNAATDAIQAARGELNSRA